MKPSGLVVGIAPRLVRRREPGTCPDLLVFAKSPDRMISFKCGRAKHHPGSHLVIGVSDDRSWVLTWRPQASSPLTSRRKWFISGDARGNPRARLAACQILACPSIEILHDARSRACGLNRADSSVYVEDLSPLLISTRSSISLRYTDGRCNPSQAGRPSLPETGDSGQRVSL